MTIWLNLLFKLLLLEFKKQAKLIMYGNKVLKPKSLLLSNWRRYGSGNPRIQSRVLMISSFNRYEILPMCLLLNKILKYRIFVIFCNKNKQPQKYTVLVKKLTGYTLTKNLRVVDLATALFLVRNFPPYLLSFSEMNTT